MSTSRGSTEHRQSWPRHLSGPSQVSPLSAENSAINYQPEYSQEAYDHYRETIENYRWWSPQGYLHYGFWRWPMNPLALRAMLEEMNSQVFQQLRLNQLNEGRVADLGCGIGGAARFGFERYPKLQWNGVNLSVEQVAAARDCSSDKIAYHCADYHRLPWQDNSFDGAYFMESLCYSLNPTAAISEACRILRPGARLVITDGFLRRSVESTSVAFRRLYRAVVSNWAVPDFHEIGDIHQWSDAAGVRIIGKRDLSWRLAPSAFQAVPRTILGYMRLFSARQPSQWRWRQLKASGLSLWLGLYQRNFGYYLIVLEK